MLRARVALAFDGENWYVDLPSYVMVPGSALPIAAGVADANGILAPLDAGRRVTDAAALVAHREQALKLEPTVVVDLPEYTPLDGSGQINKVALAGMYAGTRFAAPDYEPPVLSAP